MAGIKPIAQRIRFSSDITLWNGSALKDLVTNATIVIASGADLQFELMFSYGALADATVIDYSEIAAVYIQLQDTADPHAGTIYWSQSIAAEEIENGCAVADWTAGTDQQIKLFVANALNSLQPTSGSQTYWLCIYAVTTDATPRHIPFLTSKVSIVDSGLPILNPTLPQPFKVGTKLSFTCADAQTRDVTIAAAPNGRWTLDIGQAGYNGAGQATYSVYCADGQWRDLTLILEQGTWTLDIAQNGHS